METLHIVSFIYKCSNLSHGYYISSNIVIFIMTLSHLVDITNHQTNKCLSKLI